MEEREYQTDTRDKCLDFLADEKESGGAVAVAPTGSGKSFIIAMIVDALNDQLDDQNIVLVVQPTKELLKQNVDKIRSFGVEVNIFSASMKSKKIGKVTYATASSLKDHKVFENVNVKVLIQDECHLRSGKGTEFKKFVKGLRVKRFIGLTASPVYLESSFGVTKIRIMIDDPHAMYKKIIACVQIKEMIERGYWAKLKYQIEDVDTSLLKPNTTGTDFTESSLDDFFEENDIYHYTNEIIAENASKRSIMVFVSSTRLADRMAEELKEYGAVSVHGKTPAKIRDQYIQDYKDLKIRVIVTVLALATGFDHPRMDMLIDCAPTGSFQLYYQKWGRIVRTHPDKDHGLIVDMAGNFDKFGKLEDIRFINIKTYGWVACSRNRLLTDVALAHGENVNISELVNLKKQTSVNFYTQRASKEAYIASKQGPTMPWGKYKGKKVHELAETYQGMRFLTWAYNDPEYYEKGTNEMFRGILQEYKKISEMFLRELGAISNFKKTK